MQWFEKEDFWINFAPIMFDDARWAEAYDTAAHIKRIANLKDGDSILDAGCGLGRISVELAAQKLDVTGVDIIQSELDVAKESAEAEGVPLKLINQDLRNFNQWEKYDCAVNLYTSFGYCDTIEEDMLILKNILNSVKKGGTFIMECTSRESAILYFTKGELFDRASYTVKTEFSVSGAWEGLVSKWILYPLGTDLQKNPKAKPVLEHTFTQRLYPATFLKNKILEFGFSKADVYGEYDFSPYDEHLRTMIIVARK